MDISPATVKRHWTVAKAWLTRELEGLARRMNAARWKQVNDLFHAALERGPARIGTRFSRHGGAATIRISLREVQSLLAAHHGGDDQFLETPAWGVAPELMFDDPDETAGRQRRSVPIA